MSETIRSLQTQTRLTRLLVVFAGSSADPRALDTALELARCTGATLEALLVEPEFRRYTPSVDEFRRLRDTRRDRIAEHAFSLCEHAIEHGHQLPLHLASDVRGWLRDWIDDSGFGLVVVAHEHHPLSQYLPGSLLARVRRNAACPVVAVK
jgi:nucleotide-binding universal stress UspA family protein